MWNVKFVIDNFHLVLRFWVKNLSILVWFHMKSLKSRDSGMNKNSRYRIEVNLDSVKCYKFFQPWIFDELKLTDPSLRNTFKKVSCIAYKYYFPTFNWIDKSFRVWQYVDSHYMRRVRLENQKKKEFKVKATTFYFFSSWENGFSSLFCYSGAAPQFLLNLHVV